MKTTVILNSKIQLVDEFQFIKITILCPARNISKIVGLTGAVVFSKYEKKVDFNHHAGKLYMVTIRVRFDKIKGYLSTSDIHSCVNLSSYYDLLSKNRHDCSYNELNLLSEKVALYAFGDCGFLPKNVGMNTVYQNVKGHRISLVDRSENAFGNKRYISFKGVFYSNRKF